MDENELSKNFSYLDIHKNQELEIKDDEMKGQKVWQKLQQAAATKNSSGGKKRIQQNNSIGSGFGSSNSNQSLNGNNNRNGGVIKKPPLPDRKNELNYLEKNIEAIKNKENLTHRYPEKKYELVHGKNLGKNG